MAQKRNLPCIFILGILLCIFLYTMIDVLNNGPLTKIDMLLNAKVRLLWNPGLNSIIIKITKVADAETIIIFSILLLAFLAYKKRFRNSLLLVLSMSLGELLKQVIKFIAQRARPENALIYASGYSFPSGHAMTATILFSLLIYFFKDDIKNKLLKSLFIAFNMLLILLIGFSRVYLAVHWLSDVIAGFALGLFLLLSLSLLEIK